MAMTIGEERRILAHDEFLLVEPSHYPALAELSPEDLRSLVARLRDQHNRARDLMRNGRRARRGKGEPRAATGALGERLGEKKQVFVAALKRVNNRFEQLTAKRRREEHRAALRAALARRQAQRASHPGAGETAGQGMRRKGGGPAGWRMDPRRIGSISQANKAAQARRDG
jgi:hypothetical protein